MTDSERTDAIASLKRVRAKLESALHADAKGQAPRGNDPDASCHLDEAKMAGSPIYKSWKLVGEAIEALCAVEDANRSADGVDRRTEDRAAPDDLTCIRGIDAALAQHLASLGVTRFAEIAAWRSDDVHNVSQALGFSREISRQNWIEQAALLDRRKSKGEIETAAPAKGHGSELRSDLQEIVEAARKDSPAHEGAPSPFALELASQILGDRADTTGEAAPAALAEATAPLQPASPVAPRIGQHVSDADKPAAALKHSLQQAAQIPTVAVSARASADAAERARRLEQARQRLAESAELADSERLHDVGEAAVTFVIREPERAQERTFGSSTPRAKPDLNRLPSSGRSEPSTASYVASQGVVEEAEVVVVKPQIRYGAAKRPEGGPVRRFIRALTGG